MNAAVYAGLFAFIICMAIGPWLIGVLTRLKFGQSIREEGPRHHQKKSGTPTMGGSLILIALTLSVLIFGDLSNPELSLALFVTLSFGLIGLIDDFIIVVKKRNLGLKARHKLLAQIILSGLLGAAILTQPNPDTTIALPFTDLSFDLGWAFLPFIVFIVVGFSNAVNITDGLDGLAAGTMFIASVVFSVVCFTAGQRELGIFCAALAGSCLGFGWFNAHPAQVFMGDTGSLALGAAIAAVAVLTGTELTLIIIGGVFVIETASVMIQVASYKTRKKRVFKMSPLHHHFELVGWMETKVVTRFWIAAVLVGVVGLLAAL